MYFALIFDGFDRWIKLTKNQKTESYRLIQLLLPYNEITKNEKEWLVSSFNVIEVYVLYRYIKKTCIEYNLLCVLKIRIVCVNMQIIILHM